METKQSSEEEIHCLHS